LCPAQPGSALKEVPAILVRCKQGITRVGQQTKHPSASAINFCRGLNTHDCNATSWCAALEKILSTHRRSETQQSRLHFVALGKRGKKRTSLIGIGQGFLYFFGLYLTYLLQRIPEHKKIIPLIFGSRFIDS
jgi:hypothetical protein